ncbi:GNAT family N-acetyltransferase [Desertibacillus haloalkaliphilus]|uniref:GNAT family N-acetyltransferase n=1 Tax=Desertibacillus haloalkaliphilus TaxID=1328930 RepID=UPI001C258B74|nr:GNAT family N-acetyltransferase [Desertibacillus haloalkaliphilus]MBU8907880.1 GNAT family N-acetyltransferase [Desertibacillus haloalkaliphilus]
MFIRYKQSYKKIAMGLISYMPKEKEIKKLQETIDRYETDDRYQLYLWKEDDDIIGVLGLFVDEDTTAELCHLSVNPSYRQEGIGRKMIAALQEIVPGELRANEDTIEFFEACMQEMR